MSSEMHDIVTLHAYDIAKFQKLDIDISIENC